MRKQGTCNIGLSIGTRRIGIAVIQSTFLQAYKVLTFRGRWSQSKLTCIIDKLAELVLPYGCIVGIKVPQRPYCTQELQEIISVFLELLRRHEIPYRLFTINDLKAHCFPYEKSNKRMLVQCIGTKYQELFFKYQLETSNKHLHYTKLFEATVAAEIVANENVL